MAYDPVYGEEQFLYPEAQYEREEEIRKYLGLPPHNIEEDINDIIEDDGSEFDF